MRGRSRAGRTWGRRVWTWIWKGAVAFLLGTALPVLALRWVPPVTSAFMLERTLAVWVDDGDRPALRYYWVPWEGIAPAAALAVIAAEDQRFPAHHGFDLDSIAEAWDDRRDGRRLRGASTISQQVAKNLFLWPQQSFVRKGVEAYFTALVELLWSKRRILEVYLNIAELGDGVYGVGAAADVFFGKPASRITIAEAALLAAVLPSPRRLRVDRPSQYVRQRQAWIADQMGQLGGREYLKTIDTR